MPYQALYRSYRPTNFKEVVGQEHVIHTLKNAVKDSKTSHAYVFSGLRGVGKTTIARILAKAVNCENSIDGEPCNCCPSCQAINNFMTTDIIELDAASNNGVDEIREILEKVNFQPSMLRKKVYIIDEVHMLTQSAFNALLKTLEEPPAFVIFILATTEPHKIPATILSRCQRFDFKQLTINELSGHLKEIANKESIEITDEAINSIAEAAEGGMRDAISILDQTATYTNDVINIDDVNNITGNVTSDCLIDVVKALNESNSTQAIKLATEIINNGKETSKLISGTIELCKDILLYLELDDVPTNKSIFSNQNFIELANNCDENRLFYYIDVLNDTLNKIRFTTTPKIYLEVAIMKISSNATSQVEVMKHLQELDEKTNELKELSERRNNTSSNTDLNPNFYQTLNAVISDINQIKGYIENNQFNNELRLLDAKFTSRFQTLEQRITEKEDCQDTLIPNSYDESSINEINRKITEVTEAVLNINEEIKDIKNQNIEQEENSLFTDYDNIPQSNNNVSEIITLVHTLESRINELEKEENKSSIDESSLSPIYVEIENIKFDLSIIFEKLKDTKPLETPVVEQQELNVQESQEEFKEVDNEENIIEQDDSEETSFEYETTSCDPDTFEPGTQEETEPVEEEPQVELPVEYPEEAENIEIAEEIVDNSQTTEDNNVDNAGFEKSLISEEEIVEKNITDEVYNIHILENIMNEAFDKEMKEKREYIQENWQRIKESIGPKLLDVANILSTGYVAVNGYNSLVLVFETPQICNLLMEPNKHEQAKEVIKYTYNYDYDFLALPKDTWEEKRLEYKMNYQMGLLKPKLKPFNNPQLRVVVRLNNNGEKEKISKKIDAYFDDLN